jgi:hypothetical protein
MGTVELFRTLIINRNFESNPITQNEAARLKNRFAANRRTRLYFGLVIAVLMIGAFVAVHVSAPVLQGFPVFANVIINLLWTVPVSGVIAHAIQRERVGLTLHLLLLTPYTTRAVLLAKAAGSFAGVSKIILTGLLTLSFIGVVANMLIVPLSAYSNQTSIVFWILFAMFVIVLLFIERMQELALAASIGVFLGSSTTSPDVVIIMNFLLNLAARVLQLHTLVLLVDSGGVLRNASTIAWLNLVMGTSAALVYAPTVFNLALIAGVIALREALIVYLMWQSVRRVPLVAAQS